MTAPDPRLQLSPSRFVTWLLVFTIGSVLLVLDPTSSLGYILVGAAFLMNLPSGEWRRRMTSREVTLAFLGPLLIVGAAVTIALFAPSGAFAPLSPKARPLWYRICWSAVWVVVVASEARRTFRKAPPPA